MIRVGHVGFEDRHAPQIHFEAPYTRNSLPGYAEKGPGCGSRPAAGKSAIASTLRKQGEKIMTRYIIIDGHSGFIWGEHHSDADRDEAIIQACRATDEETGETDREYEIVDRLDGRSGYIVYDASDLAMEIHDGQNPHAIEAVERDCELVGFVATTRILDAW